MSGELGDATPTVQRDAASTVQKVTTPKGQDTSMRATRHAESVDERARTENADSDRVMGEVILPDTAEEIERMPGMVQVRCCYLNVIYRLCIKYYI